MGTFHSRRASGPRPPSAGRTAAAAGTMRPTRRGRVRLRGGSPGGGAPHPRAAVGRPARGSRHPARRLHLLRDPAVKILLYGADRFLRYRVGAPAGPRGVNTASVPAALCSQLLDLQCPRPFLALRCGGCAQRRVRHPHNRRTGGVARAQRSCQSVAGAAFDHDAAVAGRSSRSIFAPRSAATSRSASMSVASVRKLTMQARRQKRPWTTALDGNTRPVS
jgi:hypothetical protein